MGRTYRNAPIIEAVCEFRLPPQSKWDLTVPGLLYEKVHKNFPHKEQRLLQEVGTTQGPQGVAQEIRPSERVLFFNPDRKKFVQVGPRLLSINCLKPYPNWGGFKPLIDDALAALAETLEIKGFERIGLRYINRIEVRGQAADLKRYFEFRPFLGRRLPQTMTGFIVAYESRFCEGRDSCRVTLTDAVANVPKNRAFFLDLDYFLTHPGTVAGAEALDWVEAAHTQLENIFEGCITKFLRTLFQEVK